MTAGFGIYNMLEKSALKEKAEVLLRANQLAAAKDVYDKICRMDDRDADAWFRLGGIHGRLGDNELAIQCCQKAVALDPGHAEAYLNLGVAQHARGNKEEAKRSLESALKLKPGLAVAYYHLGQISRAEGNFDVAEACYQQASRLNSGFAEAHYHHGALLEIQSRTEEAVAAYRRALDASPDYPEAWSRALRALPVVYDTDDQINEYRRRYTEGIEQLAGRYSLDRADDRARAFRVLFTSTNFYLQYQGRDDRDLQARYGEFVHRVMRANFPHWAEPRPAPRADKGGRIRVGYASAFLCNHNGAVWMLGWLRHRDRRRFEVFGYHTGSKTDAKTEEFRKLCDHFHYIPANLEGACRRIAADDLHILVYPELGMDAQTQLMAGLRLAPVQCVGWGHPVTSGLPTMDYWISSDLMEPEDGQAHYTEKLIRLPNLAHCYSREQRDRLHSRPPARTREYFKLRDNRTIYLCTQSLYKYLPEHDRLLPEIARRESRALFVFVAIASVHVVRRFIARLDRAFGRAGLKAEEYCVMLPRLTPDDYVALNQIADVFLDNPSWSGNNTTLTAVDCDLPIVTVPTRFMRGRHSCAILKMLGVTDTIARDEQEYVDIAARLGGDRGWRRDVMQRIARQSDLIYEDVTCVKALEDFYQEAVGARLDSSEG